MRRIKVTPEHIEKIKKEMLKKIETQLADTRVGADGILDLSFSLNEIKLKKPIKLQYTGLAYAKQSELLRNCSSEVAWHGLVSTNDKRTVFTIHDILIYPQTVTGTTVTTNEAEYETWKANLSDEQFNAMRFQAHSHVNMGVSPSATDRELYESYLQSLNNNSFYIFMVINKSHKMHIEIYDLLNNALYDNKDIVVSVEGIDPSVWYEATFNTFVKRTPAPINPKDNKKSYTTEPYYGSYYEDSYYRQFQQRR